MAVALRLQYFRRGEACIAGNSHPFSKLPKSSLVLGGKPQEILRGKASIPVFRNVKKPLSFSCLPKPPQRTQQGRVPPGASAAPSRRVPWPRSAPLPRSAARPRRRHCSGAARAGRTAGARSAPRGSALPPPVRPPRRFPAAAALGSGSLYFRAKGKTEKKEKAKVGIPPPVTAGIKGHRAAPQEEKRRGRQRGAERRSPAGRRWCGAARSLPWDMVRGGGWQGAAAARRSWWRLRLAHGARSPRSWGERSGGRAGSAGPRRPPAGVGRGAVTDGCGAALLRRAHGASAGRQVLSLSAPRPPPRSPQRRRAPRPQRGEVSGWRAARGGGIPAPPRGREQNGEPRRDGAGGWRPSGFPGAGVT